MAQLQFSVKNQFISRKDNFKPVAKSRNYLYAEFLFLTDEWQGTATAIFRNSDSAYEVILDATNTCLVPWEILDAEYGEFYVSVFCGDLVTANKARVRLYQSGYGDDLESSQDPTPSVYAQIIERMDGVEDIVIEKTALAEGYAEQAGESAASAAGSASTATQKAAEAARSAETASGAAGTAETAKSTAVEAAGASQTASQTAVNAAGNASASELSAAQSAQSASENARTASNASQVASTKADEASQSASRAAASASEASTSATHAAGAATSASGYASDANASATAAAGSAQTASTKATQASASASSAEASANTASTANANAQAAKTAAETAQGAAEDAQEAAETARDAIQDSAAQIAQNTSDIDFLKEDFTELSDRVTAIEQAEGLARYGVSGIGQSASALTRTYDAVGMTAQVGTDGDNSNVINDFDNAAPWMWRKCVGHWTAGNGHAIFHVHAYQGDDDYKEDGTNGDYVAVECPRSYYKFDGSNLIISAHQYDGYRPFDIFCRNHDPEDTISHYYRPAYALTLKNGKAVSLPGYDNEQGAYKTLLDTARTYDNGATGTLPILYPMALSFYDWAMFTVEFATQNCQSIMQGCAGLRHSADDRLTFVDSTHALVSNWYATRVVGEYIAIMPTNVDINDVAVQATHKLTTVTRCTADGTPSSTGTYTMLELEDLGRTYYTYDYTGETEYRICGRPYRTGSCNGVSTPSGSPVSNSDSYHPMKYRWVENLYGNQYKTTADMFNKRVGTSDDDYYLEHYYLLEPWEYTPSSTSKPDATDLATDKFVKLDVETAHANYANGYVKSKKYANDYPEIWIPYETSGGSASTYTCDYAYLVHSNAVRSVRLYGAWTYGATVGLSLFNGNNAPSIAYAYSGGDLCFPQ